MSSEVDYEKQGQDFLNKTKVIMEVKYIRHGKHFAADDDNNRDIYQITFKRGERVWSFMFGNSVTQSVKWKIYPNSRDAPFTTNDDSIAKKYPARLRVLNKEFKEPSAYDVLTAITKYDPSTFEDFCADYGYDTDSMKAHKTYEAVRDEWNNVMKMFTNEELEALREIQ